MKVLIITNLYPNHLEPHRGIFNRQQFRELSQHCELTVVAPLPWVPKWLQLGTNSKYARVDSEETIDGIKVFHPKYFVSPKIGRSFYGYFYYLGIRKIVKKLQAQHQFDQILATWAYPDAFASALIAKQLNIPLIVKVHGTDVNVIGQYFIRRKMMTFAFNQAEKIIAVSNALKEKIKGFGIDEAKIEVLLNGVDDAMFKELNQHTCQRELSLDTDKKHILFIGNLISLKGIQYLIEAFKELPENYVLNVIGDGDHKEQLDQQVKVNNLQSRVTFWGRRPHSEMPKWLNAVDTFCLPSLHEGCPNVILEALACKTPVVASNVGAIPEMVTSRNLGILVPPMNAKALSIAIKNVNEETGYHSSKEPSGNIVSWSQNAKRVLELINRIRSDSNEYCPNI